MRYDLSLANAQLHDGLEAPATPTRRTLPAWLISVTVHGAAALILSWIMIGKTPPLELPPVPSTPFLISLDTPVKSQRDAPSDERAAPLVMNLETPINEPASPIPPQIISPDQPTPDMPTATSSISINQDRLLSPSGIIGVNGTSGPGDQGLFKHRTGVQKYRHSMEVGASSSSIKAVADALRWFKRHQADDGCWNAVDYWRRCDSEGKCEPGASREDSDVDVAVTGLALLCYLGDGQTPRTGPYQETIRKALAWLLAEQNRATGVFGRRSYEHAIATMALAEMLAMTHDESLRPAAQRAVDVLKQRQNRDGQDLLGWDYIGPGRRNDTSVTGWCVMALKSAAAAELDVGRSLQGARTWFQRTWQLSNPGAKPGAADFAYAWSVGRSGSDGALDRTPMGAVCGVFLLHDETSPMLTGLLDRAVDRQMPTAYPCNLYHLYYNALAVFQAGGERWKRWNAGTRDLLVVAQRRDGCHSGSWDWQGAQFPGHDIGRCLSTALCCLTLEVYDRYDITTGAARNRSSGHGGGTPP